MLFNICGKLFFYFIFFILGWLKVGKMSEILLIFVVIGFLVYIYNYWVLVRRLIWCMVVLLLFFINYILLVGVICNNCIYDVLLLFIIIVVVIRVGERKWGSVFGYKNWIVYVVYLLLMMSLSYWGGIKLN